MNRSASVAVKASAGMAVVGEEAILAFDVSSEKLNLYTELGNEHVEREFANRTDVVERELTALRERAVEHGYAGVVVHCEPSGGSERTLLNAAGRLGMRRAWINSEAVCKLRVLESNDNGKTDVKDPRVIHLVARLGKTRKYRPLEAPYSLLREWHRVYLAAEAGVVAAKDAIHPQLSLLFPDFSFKKDFLFGPTGRTLVNRFGLNPARILKAGRRRFELTMRKHRPGIQRRTLERLWQDAQLSVRHDIDGRLRAIWERRLGQLFEELEVHEERKREAAEALKGLYAEAREVDPKLPQAVPGVVTTLNLARLVAETGPLDDFNTYRQLLRFVGLSLRERQSGKYRGKTRLCKKGRSAARHVLSLCVLPLVRRDRLFGEYYHRKRVEQCMPGTKAMTVAMRQFVRLIFGWYKSGRQFDPGRVFVCESQYDAAA